MKICISAQYFPPEMGAAASRIYETAVNLKNLGHEVTVLTGFPNYPKGKLIGKFNNKFISKEEVDGVKVVRLYEFIIPASGFLKRIINYVTFMISLLFYGLLKKRFDVYIFSSPPLFLGISGVIISKIKRRPLVFDVRDIWPESVEAIGMIKKTSFAYKVARFIEKLVYKNSEKVITVTESVRRRILRNNKLNSKKVSVIKNGINPSLLYKVKKDKISLKKDKNFKVVYAGIHGPAQALDNIINAAEIIKDNDISFYFIGDGEEKSKLQELVKEKGLKNVKFMPPVKKEKLLGMLNQFDLAIVPLKDKKVFYDAIPLKSLEFLGMETPIICTARGELETLCKNSGGGVAIEPENLELLAKTIIRLKNNKSTLKIMSKKGKAYVKREFDRRNITKKLEKILVSLK